MFNHSIRWIFATDLLLVELPDECWNIYFRVLQDVRKNSGRTVKQGVPYILPALSGFQYQNTN
jgi:hypothetical protein